MIPYSDISPECLYPIVLLRIRADSKPPSRVFPAAFRRIVSSIVGAPILSFSHRVWATAPNTCATRARPVDCFCSLSSSRHRCLSGPAGFRSGLAKGFPVNRGIHSSQRAAHLGQLVCPFG